MSLQTSLKDFPDGMKVRINRNYEARYSIIRTWNRYEHRGYMIVKGRKKSDGWLRFDNKEFTAAGGSWKPECFEPIGMDSVLDDSLFEL